MPKKSFRIALAIFVGTAVLVIGIGGFYAWRFYTYPDVAHAGSGVKKQIVIPKGAKVRDAAKILVKEGIINRPSWFSFYASRYDLVLRPGTFVIADNLTPEEVMQTLSFPPAIPLEEIKDVQVTIREGKNILDVADVLLRAKLVKSQGEALAAARDRALVKRFGLPESAPSLEGYLYPETYRFRPGTPIDQIYQRMVEQHRAIYAEVAAELRASLDKVKTEFSWSDHDIVIMASLVEKETAAPEERPRIAAVFMNRLRDPKFQPKLLQTDPTIVYGCIALVTRSKACETFDGRLRRKQIDDKENPYSTYANVGLPPGPIANPGRLALAAVMKPEDSGYFYFVSKNDKTHVFSKTRAEHEAAVDKYQRNRVTPKPAPITPPGPAPGSPTPGPKTP